MRTRNGSRTAYSRAVLVVATLIAALGSGLPGGARMAAAQASAGQVVPGDSLLAIRLTDGSTLIARISAVDGDRVVLLTEGGARVEVDRASIVSVRPAAAPFADPNTSRLFFGPTGRTVAAGEGYVGLFELFFPFVSYGVTDWLTISGGTPIVPEFMGEVFYLAPKLRVLSLPRFQASAGVLAFFDAGLEGGSVGILYGVGSAGDGDRSATLGAGFPFASSGDHSDIADPIFMIGGEHRTGRITKVITENYLLLNDGAMLVSAGMRMIGERFSGDIGIGAGFGSQGSFCCLPIINVVYTFGGGR